MSRTTGGFPRGRFQLALAFPLFLVLAASPAALYSQECPNPISCTATAPGTACGGEKVLFNATCPDTPGLFYYWTFGDGGFNSGPNTFHYYAEVGSFHWKMTAYVYGDACGSAEGDISITLPQLACTVSVPDAAELYEEVTLTSTVTPSCPVENYFGKWEIQDGFGGWVTRYQYTTTFQWYKAGTYICRFHAETGNPIATCGPYEETIDIGPVGGCAPLGTSRLALHDICYVTMTTQGDTTTYKGTAAKPVDIDKALYFSQDVVLKGTPVPLSGTLSTAGDVYVPMGYDWYIFRGGGSPLAFQASGDQLVLPTDPLSHPTFAFRLNGLPMYNGVLSTSSTIDSPITLVTLNQVDAQPLFFVGDYSKVALAAIRPRVRFTRDVGIQFVSEEVFFPKLKAGIEVSAHRNFAYTLGYDIVTGQLALQFPHVTTSSPIWTELRVEKDGASGCVNALAFVPGSASDATIGGWLLDPLEVSIQNLCHPDLYMTVMGRRLMGLFALRLFSADPAALLYESPRVWSLVGDSQAVYLGCPVGQPTGTLWNYTDFFFLGGDLAVPFDAQRTVLSGKVAAAIYDPDVPLAKRHTSGKIDGSFWLYRYPCYGDKNCEAVRNHLLGKYKEGHVFATQSFAIEAKSLGPSTYVGVFRNRTPIDGKYSATVAVSEDGSIPFAAQVTFGSNAAALPPGRAAGDGTPSAAQRAVAVAGAEAWALLGATGLSGTLPSLHLVMPQGQTVTPANVSEFPGMEYSADAESASASFSVENPAAGTWTIGVDNLPETDLSFTALGPLPETTTQFASVVRNGALVDIALSIAPASQATTVDLYFSRSPDGVPEGIVAEGLVATSGSVSAQWDLSALPSSTYFLFAVTDDGAYAPATLYYDGSFGVDSGSLAAPTNLAGTRTADAATLTWTPSETPAAGGYTVLYTDAPEAPGYPFTRPATSPNGATVEGLDPLKAYRFAVQAYDELGNLSLESDTWTAQPVTPAIPGDCDGNGTVSIGEVQKAINMFLGTLAPGCGADCNGDGVVSIGELQKVINGFLGLPASC